MPPLRSGGRIRCFRLILEGDGPCGLIYGQLDKYLSRQDPSLHLLLDLCHERAVITCPKPNDMKRPHGLWKVVLCGPESLRVGLQKEGRASRQVGAVPGRVTPQ